MKKELEIEKNFLSHGLNIIEKNLNKKIIYSSDFQPRIRSSKQQVYNLLKIEKTIDDKVESVNFQHIRYKQDQKICLSGMPCNNFFIVYSGFLKTSWSDPNGNEKVLSFPMRGDILGLDGISDNAYKNDVVAISDVELIILPNKISSFHDLEDSYILKKLTQILCRELINSQKIEYIMGLLPSEARVAKFLLSLGQKYAQLGFSDQSYLLKMTRNEIGSYLGLTLETVSRALSEFNKAGIVTVDQKSIRINDLEALKKLRRISHIRTQRILTKSAQLHN
jgi:CRP/FNR family transcriptional regulator